MKYARAYGGDEVPEGADENGMVCLGTFTLDLATHVEFMLRPVRPNYFTGATLVGKRAKGEVVVYAKAVDYEQPTLAERLRSIIAAHAAQAAGHPEVDSLIDDLEAALDPEAADRARFEALLPGLAGPQEQKPATSDPVTGESMRTPGSVPKDEG